MAAPSVKKPRSKSPSRVRGMKLRSGLEATVEKVLFSSKVPYKYESTTLPYLQPEQPRKYLPDFVVTHNKKEIYIEVKGVLTSADRKKLRLIRTQYPELILVMIYGNAGNKLNKKSPTTYAMWSEKHDIIWLDVKDFVKGGIKCLLATIPKHKNGKSQIPHPKKSRACSISGSTLLSRALQDSTQTSVIKHG